MKELVEYLVKSLADHPGEVIVTEKESDDSMLLELKISSEAAASSHKKRAKLDVVS
jgi:uncharacterized protein